MSESDAAHSHGDEPHRHPRADRGSVGSHEAKTQLPKLLDRVEHGETILITRHGKPVAWLVPAASGTVRTDVRQTIVEMLAARDQQGPRLQGLTVRNLIDEGRR